jgi:hypothetical protein
MRNIVGNSRDVEDNDYKLRANHYLWSSSDGNTKYYFASESYLDGGALCQKNPFYWNIALSNVSYCIPDKI